MRAKTTAGANMQKLLKRTPLFGWHSAQGAHMAIFGEYEMPLWYPWGTQTEHLAVLTNAGIFDTSHMAFVMVEGQDAFDLLQFCFSKDLRRCVGKKRAPLETGESVYGVFLNELGEVVDDAIVFCFDHHTYMIVLNSGMGGKVKRHLEAHAGGGNVTLTDLTDRLGKLDIQGPVSARILTCLLQTPGTFLKDLGYFKFRGHFDEKPLAAGAVRLTDGTPILLSRTGYTGEFGFEIFIAPDRLQDLWNMTVNTGKDYGLRPCGLAARDALRAGAGLSLAQQDIGAWTYSNHPWTFALPFNAEKTAFTKAFIGDKALEQIDNPEYTYAFLGDDLRKVSTHAPAIVLDSAGNNIGMVLTCVTDMAIGWCNDRVYSIASPDKPHNFKPAGLSCGFIKVITRLNYGQQVTLADRRRKIKVTIVKDIRPDRTAHRPMQEMLPHI
jgi:aminomethyltransferase